jgi:glycosyltransferase involved in cell wall biosynthesis
MKIVYCIGSLAKPGGAERVLVNKANFLVECFNFEVNILIADQGFLPVYYQLNKKVGVIDLQINDKIGPSGIPLISFYKNIQVLKPIYKSAIEKIKPNVVLVLERGYEDFIIPELDLGIPVIRESHSSYRASKLIDLNKGSLKEQLTGKFFTYLYKQQMKKYDKVVLLTEEDKMDRTYLKNTCVIPNTIISFDKKISSLENKKAISVGRLDKYKNIKDQILIWEEVVKIHPNWTLHIFGEGPEKNNLQKLISVKNLDKNIFLDGLTTKIDEKYRESSFFIFTSTAEGFGMVLVEAMQCGLPVISYNCPCGPAEIIKDGKNGFLVNTGDLNTFVTRIIDVIDNENLRKNLGLNAMNRSMNYLPEVIMPQWIALFKELQ